jgi:hypothetical protein
MNNAPPQKGTAVGWGGRLARQVRRPRIAGLLLALLAGLPLGCGGSTLRLTSYRDPYFPETIRVDLASCAYRTEPGGGLHIAGRGTQITDQGATTQYLCIHIFWTPKPGKTPAEKTTTDALLRYVVATNTGVAVYTGTGFAYPEKTLSGDLNIALESGRLRLESRSGDLDDFLGSTEITGQLIARNDPPTAVTLIRETELLANR